MRLLKAAGGASVTLAMVKGRTHMSIWEGMGTAGDEVAERIIKFVSR